MREPEYWYQMCVRMCLQGVYWTSWRVMRATAFSCQSSSTSLPKWESTSLLHSMRDSFSCLIWTCMQHNKSRMMIFNQFTVLYRSTKCCKCPIASNSHSLSWPQRDRPPGCKDLVWLCRSSWENYPICFNPTKTCYCNVQIYIRWIRHVHRHSGG